MFGTSIHWTTFFYLLIDLSIVLIALAQSVKSRHANLNRFLTLGILFVSYNLTGGFLPFESFPGPFILQYIITYGVAIFLCIYLICYLYKEYDIVVLKFHLTITNIIVLVTICFLALFLLPYFLTSSIDIARIIFTIPVSLICFYFLSAFYKRISNPKNPNKFVLRRYKLSLISVSAITLLPLLTVLGDYQWITFTIMNISFYAITAIEIDRYHYFLENKNKMFEVFAFYKDNVPS